MLIGTATAAPSRAATALARARTGLLLDQTAIARFVLGAVGHTEARAVSRPLGPPYAVMAANTAEEWITHIEVIRGKIKVAHIDVPFGERARNNVFVSFDYFSDNGAGVIACKLIMVDLEQAKISRRTARKCHRPFISISKRKRKRKAARIENPFWRVFASKTKTKYRPHHLTLPIGPKLGSSKCPLYSSNT